MNWSLTNKDNIFLDKENALITRTVLVKMVTPEWSLANN